MPNIAVRARLCAKARRHSQRPGMVLIIVLVMVVMLTLGALSFAQLMVTQREAVMMSGRQVQSRALVDSGVEAIRAFLLLDEEVQLETGGRFDNPLRFAAVRVVESEDTRNRGNFTVIAPNIDADANLTGIRYGLEDESTRLNLNSLMLAEAYQQDGGRTLLMSLPGMTIEMADAILDWVDEDDEPREFGAESDYYSQLDPPYAPKNGPMDTVEELLLIRDITPTMLFGLDVNRNGVIDSNEMGGQLPEGFDETIATGWARHLTLYSRESNLREDGSPKINLNMNNMETLYNQLKEIFPDEWAVFIVAYRQNGPHFGNSSGKSGVVKQLDLTQPGQFPLVQTLDLVGAKTQVTFANDSEATILESPFSEDLGAVAVFLPELFKNVTTQDGPYLPGRVNINQAPRVVLQGIPGMTPEILEQILSLRFVETPVDNPNRDSEVWLLSEAVVTLDDMRLMMPFICGKGDVYRAQVVGYFEDGGASSRAEIVIDDSSPQRRILLWRDLSHLGRGYPVDVLGVGFDGTAY